MHHAASDWMPGQRSRRFTIDRPPSQLYAERVRPTVTPAHQTPGGRDTEHAAATSSAAEPRRSPLQGTVVLDATRVLAGPYATMILADLGAEVIKVERPGQGDDSRAYGPFNAGSSAYYASLNRGKKSVTLDLKSEPGRDAFLRLADQADVLVENFRPGVMAGLGLGWDEVHARNPGLVYASCSGFGQTGPYADRPAYDVVAQAMGGLMAVTGEEHGGPVRVGASMGDLSAALFLVTGILAALLERESTGLGAHVDVAMLDSVVALLENAIVRNDLEDVAPGRLGTRHPAITPFQAFATSDGHIVVAAGNDALWEHLCDVTGAGALTADVRFATNRDRTANHGALEGALSPIFAARTSAEWLVTLLDAGVPCGPVNGIEAVVNDPQIAAREMLVEVADREGRSFRVAGSPLRLSTGGATPRTWVASLGEHTEELLRERLGMDEESIEALRRQAVI